MPTQCLQALNNGQPCTAPVVNGSKFCRHHDPRQSLREPAAKSGETEPLILPSLLNKLSILAALNEVAQALAECRIKRCVAETLLSAIKLANRLLTEIAESGLAAYPEGASAGDDIYDPTRLNARFKNSAEDSRSKSPTSRPTGQAVTRLAASSETRKQADAFSSAHPSADRFVKDLIAKSHKFVPNNPRPDARFLRA